MPKTFKIGASGQSKLNRSRKPKTSHQGTASLFHIGRTHRATQDAKIGW